MKSKSIGVLLLLLLILIGAWQGWEYYQQRQLNQVTGWVSLSSSADANLVDKIVIDGTFELIKKDNNWLLDGTNAKTEQVDQFLEVLKSPKVELVSQNQDRYQELGVDDNQARKLSFWQGESEKFVLLVSKSNSAIVRVKDKQNVYRLIDRLNLNTANSYWWTPNPTVMPSTEVSEENPEE